MTEPTAKLREFMAHNAKVCVVAGECLPRWVPPSQVTKSRYRFEDGSTRTLSVEDMRSAPAEWMPRWRGHESLTRGPARVARRQRA